MRFDHMPRKGLAALVGLAAVPGIAFAVTTGPTTPAGPVDRPTPPVTPSEVATQVAPTLGVFDGPRTPADIASGRAALAAGHLDDPVDGENLGLRRRVDTPGAAGAVYVWPAEKGVCYAFEGGASCVDIAFIKKMGLTVSTRIGPDMEPGTIRIGGVAQDGISRVTVTREAAPPIEVRVFRNAYTADIAGTPVDVVWHDSEGEHRLPVPTG